MYSLKMRFVIFWIVCALCFDLYAADTWRLDSQKNWQQVSQQSYQYQVDQFQELINAGNPQAASKAIEKLKENYPQLASQDFDAFFKAEMLLAKGDLTKAAESYEKFLTTYSHSQLSVLYEVVLERQFAIATAFLSGQKKKMFVFKLQGYAEGEKMMEKIADRAGDSPIAKRAELAIAQSLEQRQLFPQAYEKWSEINAKWPAEPIGKKATLAMGRCKHAAYRGPKYDSSALISAKSYYQQYMQQTDPQTSQELNLENRVDQIAEQRAYKQFTIGQYYQNAGKIQAANLYYDMVISQWPDTVAAKMAGKNMDSNNLTGEMEK